MSIRMKLVKTVSYRAISAASTIGLAWVMFGSLEIAGAFGVVDMGLNSALYFLHECAWGRKGS